MLHAAIASSIGGVVKADKECYMSINRIYHRLTLHGSIICVTKFLPRHAYPLKPFVYQYQFQVRPFVQLTLIWARFFHVSGTRRGQLRTQQNPFRT